MQRLIKKSRHAILGNFDRNKLDSPKESSYNLFCSPTPKPKSSFNSNIPNIKSFYAIQNAFCAQITLAIR